MLREGINGFKRTPGQLLFGAAVTFGVSIGMFMPFRDRIQDDTGPPEFALLFAGFVLASSAAYIWYSYALDAARGNPVELAKPFRSWERRPAQLWLVLVLGRSTDRDPDDVSASAHRSRVLRLLRLRHCRSPRPRRPEGARYQRPPGRQAGIALFAIAALALLFNFVVPGLAFAAGSGPVVVAVWLALLLVTTSITLVGGAALYDVLRAELPDG